MEICFVRHTKPDVQEGVCYGQTDLQLAESFPREVAQIKQHLPSEFDTVYTSPLQRCRKLAQALQTDFIEDDQLMELNFGDWEMQSWDQLPKDQLDAWMNDYIHATPPGGESALQLFERVDRFYRRVRSGEPKRILIISHLGPIRCFYALLKEVSIESAFRDFKLPYGGIFKWTIH